MILLSAGARFETPVPVAVADAVTIWYRQQGREARLVWNSAARCGEIRVKFLPDDPRLKGFQAGEYATDYESFWLHFHDEKAGCMRAYPLGELGAEGVRALLDKANLWSGNGRHRSLQEAISAVEEENVRTREAMEKAAVDAAQANTREKMHRILQTPRTTAIRPARLAHAKD